MLYLGAVASVSLLAYGKYFWNGGVNPHTQVDLSQKIVIVTGANTGIGLETAREMARMGAHVVLACRDEGRAKGAMDKINQHKLKGSIEFIKLDLEEKKSIKQFADTFKQKTQKIGYPHQQCWHHGLSTLANQRWF